MARTKNFIESEILDRALEVFWRKGFNATSMQDLVDHLGINRASLYNTYGNKHTLYLEALKRYRQQKSQSLLIQIRSKQSALHIIKDFLLEAIAQSIQDQDQKGCFIVNAATEMANSDTTIQQFFIDDTKTVEKVLNELIIEGQTAGEIAATHSSEALARFLFNTLTGIKVMAKGNVSEKELNEVVDVTLSALD